MRYKFCLGAILIVVATSGIVIRGFFLESGTVERTHELPFATHFPEALVLLRPTSGVQFSAQRLPVRKIVAVAYVDAKAFQGWVRAQCKSWGQETSEGLMPLPIHYKYLIPRSMKNEPFAKRGDEVICTQLVRGQFIVELRMNLTTELLVLYGFSSGRE